MIRSVSLLLSFIWRISLVILLSLDGLPGVAAENDGTPITKVAFGSCASQLKACPIWGAMADYDADLLLLLGDNIYADIVEGRLTPATPARIQEAYEQLAALPDFQRLRETTEILATWDDHDYGDNDAGVEWIHKDVAAKLFHDFFGTPAESPLRSQAGVYSAKMFGPEGKRVQVIMLDTRYFRTELVQTNELMPGWRSRPYVPAVGPDATMLGEEQWSWLEEQLQQPAELRIIGSSIQFLSDEHPFEKWANFPDERERLNNLIVQTGASGVVLISGDRHLGDISVDKDSVGYPLYDVTASGLNQATQGWRMMEPNSKRVAGLPYGNHFGAIEIDWNQADPIVSLQLRHEDGEVAVQARIPLSLLDAAPAPAALPTGVQSPRAALQEDVGANVTVQFRVQSARSLSQGDRLLLNSENDFRDAGNITAVVNRTAMSGEYEGADVEKFLKKTVRVTGVISLYNERKQIVVDNASQIEIVE